MTQQLGRFLILLLFATSAVADIARVALTGQYNDLIGLPPTVLVLSGVGAPSGVAPTNAFYVQTDGASGQQLWVGLAGVWQRQGGSGTGVSTFAALTDNPINNASLATLFAGKIATAARNAVNGVAGLDSTGKLPATLLPANTVTVDPAFGSTPAAVWYDPSCGALYKVGATSPCPSTGPAVTMAVSPASYTLVRSTSHDFPVACTASNLIAAINLAATGMPTGVTASFSPTSCPSTGGTSTLTLAASGSATVTTSTVTVTGNSSGTIGTANIALTTDYPATYLTNSGYSSAGSSHTIPTTGLLDWRYFSGSTDNHKASGSGAVAVVAVAAGCSGDSALYLDNWGGGGTISWSDGSPTATSTNNRDSVHPGSSSCTLQVPVTIPDTSPHIINAYYTNAGGSTDFFAHVNDGSSSDTTLTTDATGGNNEILQLQTISVRVATAGTKVILNFRLYGQGAGGLRLVEFN